MLSCQLALTTDEGRSRPEAVGSVSESPARGMDSTSMTFLNLTDAWSIGYPFSSNGRIFEFGMRRLTSICLDITAKGRCMSFGVGDGFRTRDFLSHSQALYP